MAGEVPGEHVACLSGIEPIDHVEPLAEDDSRWSGLVKGEADDHIRLFGRTLAGLVGFHLGPGEEEAVAFLAGFEV
jgi:hypothetical protein